MSAISPVIAAIDIGSNAIRLAIARVNPEGQYEIIHSVREPVRLGHDVFATGRITEPTMKAALDAFRRFREQIGRHSVARFKAVATSAVREADNGEAFVDLVAKRHRIGISVITADEEARLVYLAVKERVHLDGKPVLFVDIGGGSVEVSLGNKDGIMSTESYAMGSVRLLRLLGQPRNGGPRFNQLVSRYVDLAKRRLKQELGGRKIELCIGTGGSIESIGDIRRALWKKNGSSRVSVAELAVITRKLQSLSVEERIERFHLRPDRADVISPAAVVLHKILQQAGVRELLIPGVGVKDGLLAELVWEGIYHNRHFDHDQVMNSALQLGRKYAFDERHAVAVSRIACQIFDQTRAMHALNGENRALLEAAAMLHDIGHYVGASNHHKHSFYLIQAGPVIGMSPAQLLLVAHIARYHRKAVPRLEHERFRALTPKQRKLVRTLASILRVADAIDQQHDNRVQSVVLIVRDDKVVFRLHGEGDMLLTKWAVAKRGDLFEEIFGEIVVEESQARRPR